MLWCVLGELFVCFVGVFCRVFFFVWVVLLLLFFGELFCCYCVVVGCCCFLGGFLCVFWGVGLGFLFDGELFLFILFIFY